MRNRTLPILVITLAAMALCGCASETAGRFLVGPERYMLYSCQELAKEAQGNAQELRELEALMAKAGVDASGRLVGKSFSCAGGWTRSAYGRRERLQSFAGRKRSGWPTRRTNQAVRRARPNTTTSHRIYPATRMQQPQGGVAKTSTPLSRHPIHGTRRGSWRQAVLLQCPLMTQSGHDALHSVKMSDFNCCSKLRMESRERTNEISPRRQMQDLRHGQCLPFSQATGRPSTSSRVTPSRAAMLGPKSSVSRLGSAFPVGIPGPDASSNPSGR